MINWGTQNIGVLLGYGNGSFAATIASTSGDGAIPTAVGVGDINNDDRLDIVIAYYYANNVGVFLGYGNGSFSILKTYSTGEDSTPIAITVVDVDIDGHLDIIVPNFGTDQCRHLVWIW